MNNQEAIQILYSMLQSHAPPMNASSAGIRQPVSPAFRALSMAIDVLKEPVPRPQGP